MNTAERERTARAEREILLANLAEAQDDQTRLVIQQLLQKSLSNIRGVMVSQAMNLCNVPGCLNEARETCHGEQWCALHAAEQQNQN
jgi:hypothetical protein